MLVLKTRVFALLLLLCGLLSAQSNLRVLSVSPAPLRHNVSVSSNVHATFSMPLDPATIQDDAMMVYSHKRGRVSGVITFDSSSATLTFAPDQPFLATERITALLSRTLMTRNGQKLHNGYAWQFDIQSSKGSNNFQALTLFTGKENSSAVAADFNGDGHTDIAVAEIAGDRFYIELADVQNRRFEPFARLEISHQGRPLYAADVDANGRPDLIALNRTGSVASIVLVDSSGALRVSQVLNMPDPSLSPRSAALPDLNGDGYLDLVIFCRITGSANRPAILLYLNDGKGTFGVSGGPHNSVYKFGKGENIFARDLNLDGWLDICYSQQGGAEAIGYFLNPGDIAEFPTTPRAITSANGDLESSLAADFNGDGLPDIAAADINGTAVMVFAEQSVQAGLPVFSTALSSPATAATFAMDYGDVDMDGDLDISTLGNNPSSLDILNNNGSAAFTIQNEYTVPSRTRSFSMSDLNDDGSLDFIVVNGVDTLALFLNKNANNRLPQAPVPLSPAEGRFQTSTTARLVWRTPADADNDSLHFRVQITPTGGNTIVLDSRINRNLFQPRPPVAQGKDSVSVQYTLPGDGVYQWSVQARDAANLGPASATRRFTVDRTAPVLQRVAWVDAAYQDWINPLDISAETTVRLYYTENFPDSAIVQIVNTGEPLARANLSSGSNQYAEFKLPIDHLDNGRFQLACRMSDRAGNQATLTAPFGIDQVAPSGTVIRSNQDTSAAVLIPLSIVPGQDGTGSGMAGLYSVRVRVNDGPWQLWLNRKAVRDTVYRGEQLHTYAFEAVGFDRVNNQEPFTGIAETTVWVDTTADDVQAPGKPLQIAVNGTNPSAWTNNNLFTVTWQLPKDESGLKTMYWKKISAPRSNQDYDSTAAVNPPLFVRTDRQGVTPIYFWFKDGRNNVDYRNHGIAYLRYDTVSPVIEKTGSTAAAYIDSLQRMWFNPRLTPTLPLQLTYTEEHPAHADVAVPWLNRTLTNTSLSGGTSRQTQFSISTQNVQDLPYDLTVSVTDSAGQKRSGSSSVAFDQTAPRGCSARTATAVSFTERFTISWSSGSDGSGSGLAQRYDVLVRTDKGAWQKWLSDTPLTANPFTGQHGRTYDFEAVNKDRVGNVEPLLGTAEATVVVDTTADDILPPPAPIQLRANGQQPSPWQTQPLFKITWQTPQDESGVVKSYFKLKTPPLQANDTTGTGPGQGPLTVTLPQEGQTWLYVWLQDRNGNVDFRNYSGVLLRYDAQPPDLLKLTLRQPGPVYVDALKRSWYNPSLTTQFEFAVQYSETQPESLSISIPGIATVRTADVLPGPNQTVSRSITIQQKQDGTYSALVTLRDVAGKVDTMSSKLGLDSTPPGQVTASAPDTSGEVGFTVNWTAGVDAGSGMSGVYRVLIREDDGAWQTWLPETTHTAERFQGRHGHRYSFEAIGFDHMGLAEPLRGVAETTVWVDTTASDKTPPPPPLALRTNRSANNFWQSDAQFTVQWQVPLDQSGLKTAFYKIGSPPTLNSDYSGSVAAEGPLPLLLNRQGLTPVYIWLMDRRNNADYRNRGRIDLGYDATAPVLSGFEILNAGARSRWFNPLKTDSAHLRLQYEEAHADSLFLFAAAAAFSQKRAGAASGTNVSFPFTFKIAGLGDGPCLFSATVTDSAANRRSLQDTLFIDQTAPKGIVAAAPATAGQRVFTLAWSEGTDADGVGMAQLYDIRVNDNGNGWQTWLKGYTQRSALFTGVHGHRYEFEAIGYDLLGNAEPWTGKAEQTTTVDTTLYDQAPPPAPLNVTVTPPGWATRSPLVFDWQNPADVSGIAAALYKVGSPPASNADTTASTAGQPPLTYWPAQEGESTLYLWLRDGRGNSDYKKHAAVAFKYDATDPVIDSLAIMNAAYAHTWINSRIHANAALRVVYSERFADSLLVALPSGSPVMSYGNLQSGSGRSQEVSIPLAGVRDGCYRLPVTLIDKSGRTTVDTLHLCVDGTLPVESRAASPVASASPEFEISWSGAGAGQDGHGSGLSGEYDVRMRIDNGPWYTWQERTRRTSTRYIGVHGHRYAFEVAAWDNVGNRELFVDQAETTTLIDTALVDKVPPDRPTRVLAGGANPSPWQAAKEFQLTWDNPVDPSGISWIHYKWDTPPAHQADTSGQAKAVQPLRISAHKADGQVLYVWLADGKGNSDYTKHNTVVLRYDDVAPAVDSVVCVNPVFAPSWYNQKKLGKIPLRIRFRESHPYQITFSNPLIPEPVQIKSITSSPFETEIKVADAADGRYGVQVTVSDSAGNHSTQYSLTIGLDSTPPRIAHQLQDTPLTEKTELVVRAVIRDENRVESASVQYWQAGGLYKSTLTMTRSSDSTYTATLPALAAQYRGLEYAIWASDGISLRREPGQEAQPSAFCRQVKVTGSNGEGVVRPASVVAGRQSEDYRMISFPLILDDGRPDAVLLDDLGAYAKNKWRLFMWDGATSDYAEYPDIESFEPGRAFWLVTSQNNIQLDTGPALSVGSKTPFSIRLKKGWNDIGNPFAFHVDWRDIFRSTGLDTQKFIGPYGFEGKWQLPFEIRTCAPWTGYSFYVEAEEATLRIPPLEAGSVLQKAASLDPRQSLSWYVTVSASVHGVQDSSNYFGVLADGASVTNYPEPRTLGSFVSLYFREQERAFATAFRPEAEGQIWEVEVSTNVARQPVKLSFKKSETFPKDISLVLQDQREQICQDVGRDSICYLAPDVNGSVRRFRLLAGDAAFMARMAPQTAMRFELLQTFPNPFNDQTMITCNLDKEGEVEAAVYNVLGQKVRQIFSGRLAAGRKQWLWDGRDQNGSLLGSGVYFVQIETGGRMVQRKLIHLR